MGYARKAPRLGRLSRWLDRLMPEALRSGDPELRRQARLLAACHLFVAFAGAVDFFVHLGSEDPNRKLIPLAFAVLYLFLLEVLRQGVSPNLVGNLTTALIFGSLLASGLTGRPMLFLVLTGAIPVAATLLAGWRSGLAWTWVSGSFLCFLLWSQPEWVTQIEWGAPGWTKAVQSSLIGLVSMAFAVLALEMFRLRALEEASKSYEDRDEARRHLSAEQQRFQALAERNYAVVAETDANGRLLYINDRVRELFGHDPEDLMGRNHLKLVHPDDLAGLLELLREHEAGDGGGARFELRVRHRRGHWIWAEAIGGAYEGPDGKLRLIYAARDISAERTARERVLEAQKLRSLGVLAGGIAHDFNNLMTVILGHASLSSDRETAEPIRRSAHRAAKLAAQLLAFSRKQELAIEPVDLNQLLRTLAPMIRSLVREDVPLELRLADDVGFVEADGEKMEQVILNLAANARDALRDHGDLRGDGKLTISTDLADLDEAAAGGLGLEPGRYARLTVADNGCGMDGTTLERAFDPFFTTKEVGEGTGLGLSIVYGIIEQSGGGLRLESVLEQGTRVRIYLPLSQQSNIAANVSALEPLHRLAEPDRETILVVEDEESLRQVICRALKKAGYRVLESPDSTAALELSRTHRGDVTLLLTDVIMPGLRGPDLAREVLEHSPDLKVLFMSGYAPKDLYPLGELGGHTGFLPKPFTPEDLLSNVAQMLDPEFSNVV